MIGRISVTIKRKGIRARNKVRKNFVSMGKEIYIQEGLVTINTEGGSSSNGKDEQIENLQELNEHLRVEEAAQVEEKCLAIAKRQEEII